MSFADLLEAAPKLESLSLEGNQLSGPLPKLRGGSGASLRLLSVKGNKLSGDVPDSWTQLGVFTVLPGRSASPSAADLPELPDYNELNLADNPFFGVLPNLTRSLPEELKPHLRQVHKPALAAQLVTETEVSRVLCAMMFPRVDMCSDFLYS